MAKTKGAKTTKKVKKGKKRRRRNLLVRTFMIVIISVVAIWYAYQYMSLETRKLEKNEELAKLEEQLQEKKKELNKKNMEVNYYQSDENIEKIARNELGLVMPQEIVIIQSN